MTRRGRSTFIGLDGGSTSSKAVLLDEGGNLLTKQYQLSKGNPIADTKELLAKIRAFVHDQGATLDVLGFGATGYAADVLQDSDKRQVGDSGKNGRMMMSGMAGMRPDISV